MASTPLPGSRLDHTVPNVDLARLFANLQETTTPGIPVNDIMALEDSSIVSLHQMLRATRVACIQGFQAGQVSLRHATPPSKVNTSDNSTQTVCDSPWTGSTPVSSDESRDNQSGS